MACMKGTCRTANKGDKTMQYSLYEMQHDVEREIRTNASMESNRLENVHASLKDIGIRLATILGLTALALPFSS